jgi:hypothetical protein
MSKKSNLIGHIYEHQYNNMPMVGKKSSNGIPLKTVLYIYEPTALNQVEENLLPGNTITTIFSKRLDSVQSNEKGAFAMQLKPGKYSVFVQYGKGYYIPYFSGNNWLGLIEIKPNEQQVLDIHVQSNASFE